MTTYGQKMGRMNEASWLRYGGFADVAWPSKAFRFVSVLWSQTFCIGSLIKILFLLPTNHHDEFAPTLVHALQPKLISVGRT